MAVTNSAISIAGHFKLTTHNPDGSEDVREADNLMTNVGLNYLAQVLMWSSIISQNAEIGSTFTATNIDPCYGAVSNYVGSDISVYATNLGAEVGRAIVSGATWSTNTFILTFFFGASSIDWVITEAAVFASATASKDNGVILDITAISPSITKVAAATATLQVTFTISN